MRALFLVLALVLLAASAGAVSVPLVSAIDESQVVPPTGSLAFGTGVFDYDDVLNILSLSVVVTNVLLGSPETAAQIHGPAAVGAVGPAIADVALGSLKLGSLDLSLLAACAGDVEACEADLLAGLWYIESQTEEFPGGEVRGQIVPVIPAPEPSTLLLFGAGVLGLVLVGRVPRKAH